MKPFKRKLIISPPEKKNALFIGCVNELERFICQLLNKPIREVETIIQTWAMKKPKRYMKWEERVRTGHTEKVIRFYLKNNKHLIQGVDL